LSLEIPHIPVLKDEVIDSFKDVSDGYICDCTTGFAGHSQALLDAYPNIKLICNDKDIQALEFSKKRLEKYQDRVIFVHGTFSELFENEVIKDKNIVGVLADIGVSSLQLDNKDRGFGFESETLDMRMNQSQQFCAKDVVNSYTVTELERIFKEYGEIREYKKVAKLIIDERKNNKFTSSKQLADFLGRNLSKGKIHPATLAFQAIRIEVNSELEELEVLLNSIRNANLQDCIVSIISFHSLEDKIVKNRFKEWANRCICPKDVFRCECGNNNAYGKVLTKKPIVATNKEIKSNPRSRSAKLRVFHCKSDC
jgi:16S rRNA (cytosine1402-N4)-methyltransferase